MMLRLSACLKWVGTPRFAAGFLDELYDHLPHLGGLLQEYCSLGTPREKSLSRITNLVMEPPTQFQQSGHFEVNFEQVFNLGSRGLDCTELVTGTVQFVLDLETGDLVLEGECVPQRE